MDEARIEHKTEYVATAPSATLPAEDVARHLEGTAVTGKQGKAARLFVRRMQRVYRRASDAHWGRLAAEQQAKMRASLDQMERDLLLGTPPGKDSN